MRNNTLPRENWGLTIGGVPEKRCVSKSLELQLRRCLN